MKSSVIAIATALTFGAMGAASAADMAVKARPIPPPVMVYNWTGCYIGGNVGGGWERTSQSRVALVTGAVINPPDNFGSGTGSAFIGGAQVGCDFQFGGNWVAGVQGMVDFGNIRDTHNNVAFAGFTDQTTVKDTITLTGRIGYLFTPQLLGYVKGGGAWARVDYVNFQPGGALSETATGVDRSGWTIGGGLEWMFAQGWSVFGEFNYMDFGRKNIAFVAAPGTVGAASVLSTKLEVEQFLVGVNYKFNFGGPVVAKY